MARSEAPVKIILTGGVVLRQVTCLCLFLAFVVVMVLLVLTTIQVVPLRYVSCRVELTVMVSFRPLLRARRRFGAKAIIVEERLPMSVRLMDLSLGSLRDRVWKW